MQSFVEKVVAHIHKKYPEQIGDICIVMPNRRAALFIKNELSKYFNSAIWCPPIYSIEDFVTLLSETFLADSTTLLFELYEAYKSISTKEIESFSEFGKWANILLNDFNEIDLYLVNADQLFGNLKDIKELDTWSLNADELTDFQKKYLMFWKSLLPLYKAFKGRLEAKNISYQGLAYLQALEKLNVSLKKQNWHKIIFAGFNALNKAEEKIISQLLNQELAEIIWDTDSYYLDDEKQEAGKFINRYKKHNLFSFGLEKNILLKENELSIGDKTINIVGAAKNIAQAKYAGNILNEWLQTNEQLKNTALVLADENLLFPVLHSLPPELSSVNITMGYPLKNTPIAQFFRFYLELHENGLKYSSNNKNSYSFHHLDVVKILRHIYFNGFTETDSTEQNQANKLIQIIQEKNLVFTSGSFLKKFFLNTTSDNDKTWLDLVFGNCPEVSQMLQNMDAMVDLLKYAFIKKQKEKTQTATALELEYLIAYSKIIKRLIELHDTYPESLTDLKVMRSLLIQQVKISTLPFYGEPLQGLQIMGMLETRTLDFENIILLSCNEGILPSGKTTNSFIPFELKRYFGLPTYSDRDAIFAYHFYRLLQRAKNVYLIYNTQSDELGGGEKSRYLAQLLYELPQKNKKIKLNEYILSAPIHKHLVTKPIHIIKDNMSLAKLKQRAEYGFSPTTLNSYRKCSLQFYFRYIASLQESNNVEEAIGSDMLGTSIHEALEQLYLPYKNQVLNVANVKSMLLSAEKLILTFFKKHYEEQELNQGKNFLTVAVANKFLNAFLKTEINQLIENEKQKQYLSIIDLEKELEAQIIGEAFSAKIIGKADRIDSIAGITRIIDYKTGTVSDKELKINSCDDFNSDEELSKSFQLLMYALMYYKMNTEIKPKISSGIITFRQLSAGLKSVLINKNNVLDADLLQDFERYLESLIGQMFDPKKPFEQTSNIENCEYCSFANICQR
jgi:ATP-dependent helicase/nuclease subunit B